MQLSPEGISMDRIARLLDGYARLSSAAGQREIETFDRLLRGFHPKWKELERSAYRFNVFDALNVRDKELFHSRFLAYLLDPRERHDQGERFLRSFLDIALKEDGADAARAVVERELPVGEWGQLDICIWLPRHVIAIENKVHAPEGHDQVGRYHKWLESQCKGEGRRKTLVFLTPKGRRPVSAPNEIASHCKCLSYADLAYMLSASIQGMDEHVLKHVIEQYVETCRDLHRRYVDEPDQQGSSSVPDGS